MLNESQVEQVKALIQNAGNSFVGVTFIKRSNGKERKMVFRLGVTKGLTGKGARYDAAKKGLLTVYDVQAKGWRSVPLDAVLSVRSKGQEVVFVPEAD